jgi:hypothetical protein
MAGHTRRKSQMSGHTRMEPAQRASLVGRFVALRPSRPNDLWLAQSHKSLAQLARAGTQDMFAYFPRHQAAAKREKMCVSCVPGPAWPNDLWL